MVDEFGIRNGAQALLQVRVSLDIRGVMYPTIGLSVFAPTLQQVAGPVGIDRKENAAGSDTCKTCLRPCDHSLVCISTWLSSETLYSHHLMRIIDDLWMVIIRQTGVYLPNSEGWKS